MVILGYGNVGSALCREFAAYETIQLTVYNRTPIKRKDQISEVNYVFELSELPEADVYVMAISDDQISDLSSSLPFNDRLVVHTCLLYTSPSPRDLSTSRMPSSA